MIRLAGCDITQTQASTSDSDSPDIKFCAAHVGWAPRSSEGASRFAKPKFRAEWPSLMDELVATGKRKEEDVRPFRHLNIVGLVGSIDNDLSSTDATIGCYSSLQRICQSIDFIDATAFSHQRAFVIEVMGRHCGWLALLAGIRLVPVPVPSTR